MSKKIQIAEATSLCPWISAVHVQQEGQALESWAEYGGVPQSSVTV
jgi:hypothetical protein